MDFCIQYYGDVFKRAMEAVNNVDVGEFGPGSLPGVQAHAQTPKSRRIEVLNWKSNLLYRGKLAVEVKLLLLGSIS